MTTFGIKKKILGKHTKTEPTISIESKSKKQMFMLNLKWQNIRFVKNWMLGTGGGNILHIFPYI